MSPAVLRPAPPQYAEVSRKNDDEELSDVGLLEPAIPGMCEEDGL